MNISHIKFVWGERLLGNRARAGVWAVLLAVAVVWISTTTTGCLSDDVAGGDDFPNSVETLGKAAAEETADSASWNAYEDAPETPPESYDSTTVPDSPPEEEPAGGMGRRAADGDRIVPGFEIAGSVRSLFEAFDSGMGLTRAVRVQTLSGIVVRDTTFFRVEVLPPARIMVRMSGAVTYPERVERFTFEDADGDGTLSPATGAQSLARARFAVERGDGRVEERTVVFSAGADNQFETHADNVLRAVETVHRVGADTVYHLVLSPVAGDSAVRDPQRDSTRVDVEHLVVLNGVRIAQSYRAELHADAARNRALRYRRVVTTASGATETVALGADSLPDFAPGDTGTVQVTFASSDPSDTLAYASATYRVVLSDTAGNHEGNRLLRVEREKVFGGGRVAGRSFRLMPSAPVPAGSFPRDGAVELRVDFRGAGWIGFVGTSSAEGFSGVWINDKDETRAVDFGIGGTIVEAPSP